MAIFDLFSKRQQRSRGEVPDVYLFDKLPNKLRVQIVHIISDAIGIDRYHGDRYMYKVYKDIHEILCREYGLFKLGDEDEDKEAVLNFLLTTKDLERALDVIELSMRYIDKILRTDQEHLHYVQTKISPNGAIEELNERFKENGIGYQYESEQLIRVDSSIVHKEITKPTLTLLWNKKFQGANEEYLKAHEHYRHGRNKECLSECLKSFESVMKIICKEKGWAFDQTDTSSRLIKICFQNDLVPSFTQNQFSSLQNLLVSGIPTIRNKVGGHGQGAVPQKVDDEMARYGLNLTGTNIIFLIEQSGL
jgi:hypothetical protein